MVHNYASERSLMRLHKTDDGTAMVPTQKVNYLGRQVDRYVGW